jgi:aminoglycoside phosphotransferase (APT) family kinase protein
VFRFPRRAIALPGIERELVALPRLARLLPLPVPEPAFVGRPASGYPWPFFGCRVLVGRELGDVALSDRARSDLGVTLAGFLRVLHSLRPAPDLPVDPNRRADMQRRVALTRTQLDRLAALGVWRAPAAVAPLLARAESLPPADATVLAHGDLHFRHVLVDDDGRATGIIDWGDVCVADRSVDLLLYWSHLPPASRADFLEAYGPVTDAQLLRARVLALSVNAALAAYAGDQGLETVEHEALSGLERAISG